MRTQVGVVGNADNDNRTATREIATRILLASISSRTLILAFPPYNLGLLISVSFVPMLVAQHWILPAQFSGVASAITLGAWLGWLSLGGALTFAIALARSSAMRISKD